MSDELNIGIAIPDVVGEVLGWRAWRIVPHPRAPQLRSCVWETIWPTSTWCRAECGNGKTHDEGIPAESCTCGLYAARDREHLLDMGYNGYSADANPEFGVKVIGQVAFAGKVIPGSLGYRAEKGRVVRLEVPYEFMDLAEPLRNTFGIEVVLANTLEATSAAATAAHDALKRRIEQERGCE